MSNHNDPVLKALLSALETTPDNVDLHLAVAKHLMAQQQAEQALHHCQQILSTLPTHIEALEIALESAKKVNNETLASGYQQLLNALQPQTTETQEPTPEPVNIRKSGAKLSLVQTQGTEQSDSDIESETSDITLANVGGMLDVKKRLNRAFLAPLQNPELIAKYGKTLGGGLMLYGPPGCGKSFIAKALAGEIGARFYSVGLTDVLDMYMGNSEQKLQELFATARRNAPAVLFFDEIDAIGQKRSQLKNSGMRNVVNQLLTEMNGIDSDNTNLFVLGATNHPWDVDSALRRSGRFDRVVAVFPPDEEARLHILQQNLADKPTEAIDLTALAQKTEGFSGADLKHLCDSAAETAIETAIETGTVCPITQKDIDSALKEVKPTTKEWFETARNFALFSNQSGAYDDLLDYMRTHKI